MASVSPSSPEESPPSSRTQSPPSSSTDTESASPSSSPETSSGSSSLLPELEALKDPRELSLEEGLPDNAAILRACRLRRKQNHVRVLNDTELAKAVADEVVTLWASVASQFSGTRLQAPHNIMHKVKNLMSRFKFAYNDCNTKISEKQQKILARDAPKLFDIRSCR